jgi:nitrite reductase (NO-forming)
MRTTRITASLLTLLLAVLVSGCGEGSGSSGSESVTHVELSLQDMEFVPDRMEVAAGETITVDMSNDGQARHDLLIETGFHSPVLVPGEEASVEIGPFEAGTYEAICTIPGHQQAGMVLEVEAR